MDIPLKKFNKIHVTHRRLLQILTIEIVGWIKKGTHRQQLQLIKLRRPSPKFEITTQIGFAFGVEIEQVDPSSKVMMSANYNNRFVHMTSYSHLSPTETAIMTLLSILSNLAGLPIVARSLPNKCTRFEGIVVAMSILTSMLYHICEIYDCTLFLN